MTINLDTLRKAAEAATQADWYALRVGIRDEKEWVIDSHPTFICSMQIDGERAKSDAEFIATFDPPTVLALLSRLEQAEQQVQAVLRLADDWETGALRWEDPLRVPNEVFLLRKALQQPTHEPDWTDYQLGDPGASCSCGYNGPYKECWQSRRALDGDGRG